MNQSFLYLLVNFFTVLVPFIFSFHPKLQFHKKFRSFFMANVIVLLIFCVWDYFFTSMGVWGFNDRYVTGVYILNLPIEEILFFICIPFACVFTYHCINRFYNLRWTTKSLNISIALSAAILLMAGIYFLGKMYTSATFISLGIVLLITRFILKADWIGNLISVYGILLVPFFIVNGILTGTGPEQPVVWYNEQEIAGLRLFTIPFEDIFYGFELVLLNVFLYHYFEGRSVKSALPEGHASGGIRSQ